MAFIEQLVAHAKGKQQLRRSKNKRLRQACAAAGQLPSKVSRSCCSRYVRLPDWEDPLVDLEALIPQGWRTPRRDCVR